MARILIEKGPKSEQPKSEQPKPEQPKSEFSQITMSSMELIFGAHSLVILLDPVVISLHHMLSQGPVQNQGESISQAGAATMDPTTSVHKSPTTAPMAKLQISPVKMVETGPRNQHALVVVVLVTSINKGTC